MVAGPTTCLRPCNIALELVNVAHECEANDFQMDMNVNMGFGVDLEQQQVVAHPNIDTAAMLDAQVADNNANIPNLIFPENFVLSLKPLVKEIVQEELNPILEQLDDMKMQLDGVKMQQDNMKIQLNDMKMQQDKILEEIWELCRQSSSD